MMEVALAFHTVWRGGVGVSCYGFGGGLGERALYVAPYPGEGDASMSSIKRTYGRMLGCWNPLMNDREPTLRSAGSNIYRRNIFISKGMPTVHGARSSLRACNAAYISVSYARRMKVPPRGTSGSISHMVVALFFLTRNIRLLGMRPVKSQP